MQTGQARAYLLLVTTFSLALAGRRLVLRAPGRGVAITTYGLSICRTGDYHGTKEPIAAQAFGGVERSRPNSDVSVDDAEAPTPVRRPRKPES